MFGAEITKLVKIESSNIDYTPSHHVDMSSTTATQDIGQEHREGGMLGTESFSLPQLAENPLQHEDPFTFFESDSFTFESHENPFWNTGPVFGFETLLRSDG